MHQHRFEDIEAWLLGTMPAAEQERFASELERDPRLKAEVDLQRENMFAVELEGLRKTMRSVARDNAGSNGSAGSAWRGFLKYAAVVALLISAAVWWFTRPSEQERLFAAHFVVDPGLPVPMSITDHPVFHDAMVAYKLGDHAEARAKWAPLLQVQPSNDTLNYYIGSAAIADGDVEGAIPLLRIVAADTASHFAAKARWYLFLAYLHTGDDAARRDLGCENDPVYGARAKAINESLSL